MLKPVASREENVAGPDDLAPAGEVERLFVGRHFRLFPRDGFCSRSQDGLLALHGQQLCL